MSSDKGVSPIEAVTFRPLGSADDLADLIKLSRAFFVEYADHHEEFFQIDEIRDADVADYFRRSLNHENAATFVAVLAERMIGYITVFIREQPSFYRVKRIGAISGLMVAPEHRRKGIASRLLDHALTFFRKHNIVYVTVFTSVANVAGLRFYERHGMQPLHMTMVGHLV